MEVEIAGLIELGRVVARQLEIGRQISSGPLAFIRGLLPSTIVHLGKVRNPLQSESVQDRASVWLLRNVLARRVKRHNSALAQFSCHSPAPRVTGLVPKPYR
ncbi:hypothetical protein PoB_006389100 [Plakobranchus ocellatus]|uniref:Uncharacterized protein n=1 Tax=Plakobranchus ocellatus TaxID=259542 RepID=A0AAV4CZZ3_9GAST|nr:hypothetical protein PoB_006389100 [Plakobranchus ocellatus]